MKINLQKEMGLIKELETAKGQPAINKKSRRMIEQKKTSQPIMMNNQSDVYSRLYEHSNKSAMVSNMNTEH